MLILRNRLKYALTGKETKMICMEKLVQVDGKVRTDPNFPAGFMDVVEMPKAADAFRLIYDTKGRFVLHRVSDEEKQFKLCRVNRCDITQKKIPVVVTHDGRTIRYPDPLVKANDTVKVDIATGKITGILKFESGNMCMVTKGRNTGRVGIMAHIEKHPGSFDIAVIRDASGNSFSTRSENVFVIGNKDESAITLPKGKGIKLDIIQERENVVKMRKANA
jgi:ribosomal protein S4E